MRHSRLLSIALALGLAALTALPALAWPDQPPDFATISGPGIVGEVKITDPSLLASLALGAVEDFDRGVLVASPALSDGYVTLHSGSIHVASWGTLDLEAHVTPQRVRPTRTGNWSCTLPATPDMFYLTRVLE